jgi:hypothetical protein
MNSAMRADSIVSDSRFSPKCWHFGSQIPKKLAQLFKRNWVLHWVFKRKGQNSNKNAYLLSLSSEQTKKPLKLAVLNSNFF